MMYIINDTWAALDADHFAERFDATTALSSDEAVLSNCPLKAQFSDNFHDYRAAITVDLAHGLEPVGERLSAPALLLYSASGAVAKL